MIKGVHRVEAHDRIVFGEPVADAVAGEIERCGASRVFVFASRSLARLTDGPLQQVERALGTRHAGSFAEIRAHSPRTDVLAGARAAARTGADCLVAVGGGSVIDATKAVQLCLWWGLRDPAEFDGLPKAGEPEPAAPAGAIRALAVPTTFSGAEMTSIAGVTDDRTSTKQIFGHPLLAPRCVILDPAATLPTPLDLLFPTGIRAVDHAVETFCSPLASPVTECQSLQGLRMLGRSLPSIRTDPANLPARLDAQLGTWQAIAPLAAGVGVGASHGIGYVLGGTYGVGHGATSCVLLPAVLAWNAAVNGERQAALSEALGSPGVAAGPLVRSFVEQLGLPSRLRDVGIEASALDDIAERALQYKWVQMNPRPITSAGHVRQILDLAW